VLVTNAETGRANIGMWLGSFPLRVFLTGVYDGHDVDLCCCHFMDDGAGPNAEVSRVPSTRAGVNPCGM
jgi:hypothetical protein